MFILTRFLLLGFVSDIPLVLVLCLLGSLTLSSPTIVIISNLLDY